MAIYYYRHAKRLAALEPHRQSMAADVILNLAEIIERFASSNCASYAQGVRVANVVIADIRHEDRFVWVGLFEPDEKLLREIQEVERDETHADLFEYDSLKAFDVPAVDRWQIG
jgi:hypothetical protein